MKDCRYAFLLLLLCFLSVLLCRSFFAVYVSEWKDTVLWPGVWYMFTWKHYLIRYTYYKPQTSSRNVRYTHPGACTCEEIRDVQYIIPYYYYTCMAQSLHVIVACSVRSCQHSITFSTMHVGEITAWTEYPGYALADSLRNWRKWKMTVRVQKTKLHRCAYERLLFGQETNASFPLETLWDTILPSLSPAKDTMTSTITPFQVVPKCSR